jgi:hypothetical protein
LARRSPVLFEHFLKGLQNLLGATRRVQEPVYAFFRLSSYIQHFVITVVVDFLLRDRDMILEWAKSSMVGDI